MTSVRFAIALAVFLMLSLSEAAFASNWVRVTAGSSGTVWYVDLDSIRDEGGYRRAWFQLDHRNDPKEAARTTKFMEKINCSKWSSETISRVSYRSDGSILTSRSVHDDNYEYGLEPIIPDSVLDAAAKAVCS